MTRTLLGIAVCAATPFAQAGHAPIQSVDPAARVHADVPARRVQVVSNQPREIVEATLTKSGYQAVWIAP